MIDLLTKPVLELFQGNAQDKLQAQTQLGRVLDARFQPCLDLWKVLWDFADRGARETGDPTQIRVQLEALDTRLNAFIAESGALVSTPCFQALLAFRSELMSILNDEADSISNSDLRPLARQLSPHTDKDSKSPGLFYLLRDELGSNAKAAVSVLK